MKAKVHPKYVACTVTCGCGATFQTRSTSSEIHVDICSQCHPFYTGKQKLIDTAGRVERFRKRYEKVEQLKKIMEERRAKRRARREARAAPYSTSWSMKPELGAEDAVGLGGVVEGEHDNNNKATATASASQASNGKNPNGESLFNSEPEPVTA